ncbi:MAG: CHAD domain-containing protein [Rhodospirillales bacterium]|nr:CHAD domain-containing protein [Rhodospirillales bacterium]MDE0378545.1 CHAD domain-containing protein [Rhodospirillales bacterium]
MAKAGGEAGTDAAGGDPALEVELTLGGDAAALDRGWRAAVAADSGGTARRLHSTYYDTGDFRLRRRGFTLRVRDDGERLVQTLKADGPSGGGALLRRNEWSRPVETPEPSLPVASDAAVRDAVGPLRPSQLAPAFSTDVMRRTAVVEVAAPDRGKALVELALDSGEIRARNRRETISELELELVEGPASALYELAMTMQASASLRIQTASKAKRGFVLAGGEGYAGYKAPPLSLGCGVSVDETLGKIFRICADQCAANHDAVLDGSDPEGVHQFRVALRRLRSALSAFKGVLSRDDVAWLNLEAERLISLLGPARDWDVFIAEMLAAVRSARPDDETLESLAAAAGEERARAYEKAEALRAPAHTAFLLRFGRWIETAGWREGADHAVLDGPLVRLAGPLLDKRHRRVLKRGRNFEQLSDARLHQLRITLKKLRYAGEFFAAQFPDGKPRPYIRALRRLQDDLGGLNDAAVAEHRVRELLDARRGSGELAALGVGAGQVIGWHVRACAEARPRIVEDWHAFTAAQPYWRPGGGSMA